MFGVRLETKGFLRLIAVCASLSAAQPSAYAQSPVDGASGDGQIFDLYLIGDEGPVTNGGPCAGYGCYAPGCDMPGAPSPMDSVVPPSEAAPAEMDLSFVPPTSQGPLGRSGRVAMIGDFFGPVVPTQSMLVNGVPTVIASGSAGFQIGRQKIVENTSPIPQDRVFLNYSYFDNVPLVAGGMPVNRYTPGFEKTFCDGQASFEIRFPFASTLDSDLLVDATGGNNFSPSTNQVEFGNITMFGKAILHDSCTHALTAGLGVSLPTANDVSIFETSQSVLLEVENESVHLLPFIGGVWTPNDRFFAQGVVQFDVDANGNPVTATTFNSPARDTRLGTVNDPTLLYVDVGVGCWVYRDDCACSSAWITGIAPRAELHYNAAISDPDMVRTSGSFTDSNNFDGRVATGQDDDFEVLNALVGVTVELHHDSMLTVAYVTPVGGDDQFFDGELRVLLNYFYGPSGATRRSVFAR